MNTQPLISDFPKVAEMLESLLADNVRLSGDKLHFAEYIVGLEEELTAKDERIAALEKDAARFRMGLKLHDISAYSCGQPIEQYLDEAIALAALNPAGQCSGTATGREG